MPEENAHTGGDHIDSVTHHNKPDIDETVTFSSESDGGNQDIRSFSDISLSRTEPKELLNAQQSLLESESEEIGENIDSDDYLTAAVRMNALFESYIEFLLRAEYQNELGRSLSDLESDTIKYMGHGKRVKKAKDFDVVGSYVKGALSTLQNVRNDPAHKIWSGIEVDDEMENQVNHAYDQLTNHIEHLAGEHS